MEIRVGIIGCGRIADRFAEEIKRVEGIEAAAVYNPHADSAQRFAVRHGIAQSTDELEEMLANVDAVYVASPHSEHVSYTKTALEAGKHVLCEKPMAFSKQDAQALFSCAKDGELVLMEALKTAYCPGYQKVLDIAHSGQIGRIRSVEAVFTRLVETNGREYTDANYGGSFTEYGNYGMLPVFDLLGTNYRDVHFTSIKAPNGIDSYTRTSFEFGMEDELTAEAIIKTGVGVKAEGQLVIAGSAGYILVPSPWWLTSYFEVRYEDPNKVEKHVCEFASSGLRYEIEDFRKQILYRIKDGRDDDIMSSVREEGSVAAAGVMEKFLASREPVCATKAQKDAVKIWAHRGMSMEYPENTLPAFEAAAKIKGITGIELDVQYTKDGQIVVFHDETIDRVTEGSGAIAEYTLAELKEFRFRGTDPEVRIPTLKEVLELLKAYCEKGLKINIELKTSVVRYEGIEQETYNLVKSYGLLDNVIWSSFLAESIEIIKEIDPKAHTGMLAGTLADCMRLGDPVYCDAYHPGVFGLGDINCIERAKKLEKPVRAWNMDEPLFGSGRRLKDYDLREYALFGVTDIFTNVAGRYV